MGKSTKKQRKPVSRGRKVARIIGIIIGVVILGTAAMCIKVFSTESEAQHSIADYQKMFPETTIAQQEDETVVISPKGADANTGVIFYVGAQIAPEAYTPVMAELAQRGYTCWIPKMTCNFPALSPNVAADIIQANPDIASWYIGGHSMGGLTAAGWAADNPDAVDGIIFLAAFTSNDLTETDLPLISIYGSEDAVLSKDSYEKALAENPKDFEEHIIPGANHGHFGDYGEQLHDNAATISSIDQWEQTADLVAAWIERHR